MVFCSAAGRALDKRPYAVMCLLAFLPEDIGAGRGDIILFAAVGAISIRPLSRATMMPGIAASMFRVPGEQAAEELYKGHPGD